MSLRKTATIGVVWTLTQQLSVQIINFIVQIILARLLMPEAFGLIAMLQVFLLIGSGLMDGGMTSSLIRTSDAGQKDFSTVFFINVIVSVAIYVILFFAAPFISEFYKQPLLTNVLRVYTISFVITALVGVQTTILTKDMRFKLQMIMQVPSVLVGGIVGIVLAYYNFGVWSLVWLNLVQSFLFMIQHWIHSDWRPEFIIDKERLKFHFNFGYKITLSTLLFSVYKNLYNVIIGKFFSPLQVGFYYQADTLRMFPVQQVTTALDKVTYPLFSNLQGDDEKLKYAYKSVMQMVLFIVVPVMTFLAVFAKVVFLVVLGGKWLPAVPFFQILCIAASMQPLQTYNLNILKVKGRSDLLLRLNIITKIIPAIFAFFMIPFGIYGLIWFQTLFAFLLFYINTFYSGKMINYSIRDQVKDIWGIFFLAVTVGGASFALNVLLLQNLHVANFIKIIIGGLFYVSLYLIISNYTLSVVQLFKQILSDSFGFFKPKPKPETKYEG